MNAGDILKYGHLTVLGTIDGLPDDAWEQGSVCGEWSIKDILAHLASFELVLVDILGTFTGDEPTPHLDAFREGAEVFNEAQVDLRRGHTAAETLAEYVDAHDQVRARATHIPEETWRQVGTLPWYGAEYALDDLIVYQYYGHKREHCAQIALDRDRQARERA